MHRCLLAGVDRMLCRWERGGRPAATCALNASCRALSQTNSSSLLCFQSEPVASRPAAATEAGTRPLRASQAKPTAEKGAMKWEWELNDENVLCLSGIASGAFAVQMLAFPRKAHDAYYVLQEGEKATDEHVATCRWFGQALTCDSLSSLTVGLSDDSKDAKKNLLKASSAAWLMAGGMHAYYAQNGVMKKEVAAANIAISAALAGLCAWRGFKEDDEEKKDK